MKSTWLGPDDFGNPCEVQQGALEESRLPRRLTALLTAASLTVGLSLSGDTSPVDPALANPGTIAGKIIDEDAAITGDLACSAFLIRDPRTGKAVGALTAAHCGYANPELISNEAESGDEPAWFSSTTGREYVIFNPGAESIETGDVINRLQVVGQVTESLAATDGTSDEAIAIFGADASPGKVESDLKAELATDAQIRNMVPGQTKIYDAGWPQDQNGDGHGNRELQRFAATYIGMGTTKIETGKTIDVIWAAFPRNRNGASCTPGMSGSGAFIVDGGKPALLGSDSKGYATTAHSGYPELPEAVIKQFPGFDWSQYATVCGFARPALGQQPDTLLHIVTNPNQIPGLVVDSLSDTRDLLNNPQYIPTAIEGVVLGTSHSEVDGHVVEATTAYRNPVVFVNANGSVVLVYYDARGKDTTLYGIQKFADISDLTVYATNPNEKPHIVRQQLYTLSTDPAQANNLGGFVDNGVEYGTRYTKLPVVTGQGFNLAGTSNESLVLTPTP